MVSAAHTIGLVGVAFRIFLVSDRVRSRTHLEIVSE